MVLEIGAFDRLGPDGTTPADELLRVPAEVAYVDRREGDRVVHELGMERVDPLASKQEFRVPLDPDSDEPVIVTLQATSAGAAVLAAPGIIGRAAADDHIKMVGILDQSGANQSIDMALVLAEAVETFGRAEINDQRPVHSAARASVGKTSVF